MTNHRRLGAQVALLLSVIAQSHEGHDHAEAMPAQLGVLNPRAEASSENFELLTEVKNQTLYFYLDRYTDNTPILGANIEVESNGFKGSAIAEGDHYKLDSAPIILPGKHSLIFTITTAQETDLLETTLDISPIQHIEPVKGHAKWLWIGGVIVAAFVALIWRSRRNGK